MNKLGYIFIVLFFVLSCKDSVDTGTVEPSILGTWVSPVEFDTVFSSAFSEESLLVLQESSRLADSIQILSNENYVQISVSDDRALLNILEEVLNEVFSEAVLTSGLDDLLKVRLEVSNGSWQKDGDTYTFTNKNTGEKKTAFIYNDKLYFESTGFNHRVYHRAN